MTEHDQILRDAPLSQSPYWEAVDAVVCINLDRRKDRWKSFCKAVKDVIPKDKLHRVSGVEGVMLPGYGELPWFTERTGVRSRYWGGAAGCMMAHARVIKMAQQNGWRNVMILEDDISANVTPEGLSMIHTALTTLTGRYLLYLGYAKRVPRGLMLKQADSARLWRINGALTTHAYIIPASMYRPLLEALPSKPEDVWAWIARHRAIDVFYRNEVAVWSGVRICAVLPLMFHQNGMSSDLVLNVNMQTSGQEEPQPLRGLMWYIYHRGLIFFRRLKTFFDTRRTYRRAFKGGFPGYRAKGSSKFFSHFFH